MSAPAATAEPRGQERIWAGVDWLLIAGGLGVQLFCVLKGIWGDGSYRFNYLQQLLDQHTFSNFYYSYAGPIWALPLVAIDRALKNEYWLTMRYNVFVLVAGCAAMAWALKSKVDRTTLRAFFVLLMAASMFPFHISTFYGETFTAVAVGAGLVLLERTRWGWVLVALGVMNTPACIVPLGFVALYVAWTQKRFLPLVATVATVCAVLFENWFRRGDPFASDYAGTGAFQAQVMPYVGKPGFSYPLLFGTLALLFSFGRGLAFYAPGLWLSFAKRKAGTEAWLKLWLIFTAGLVLVYAKWWAWHGASYWGPRFHLFAALPATWLLAHFATKPKEERLSPLITLVLLAVSVWVSIDGVSFNYFKDLEKQQACTLADGALCIFTPEFSPLLFPWIHRPALAWFDYAHMAFCGAAFVRYAVPLCLEAVVRVRAMLPGREAFALKAWRL